MSEFFRDLDVVPSDIVAGLVLLRHIQKREENRLIYQSLSSTLPIENKVVIKVYVALILLRVNQL